MILTTLSILIANFSGLADDFTVEQNDGQPVPISSDLTPAAIYSISSQLFQQLKINAETKDYLLRYRVNSDSLKRHIWTTIFPDHSVMEIDAASGQLVYFSRFFDSKDYETTRNPACTYTKSSEVLLLSRRILSSLIGNDTQYEERTDDSENLQNSKHPEINFWATATHNNIPLIGMQCWIRFDQITGYVSTIFHSWDYMIENDQPKITQVDAIAIATDVYHKNTPESRWHPLSNKSPQLRYYRVGSWSGFGKYNPLNGGIDNSGYHYRLSYTVGFEGEDANDVHFVEVDAVTGECLGGSNDIRTSRSKPTLSPKSPVVNKSQYKAKKTKSSSSKVSPKRKRRVKK